MCGEPTVEGPTSAAPDAPLAERLSSPPPSCSFAADVPPAGTVDAATGRARDDVPGWLVAALFACCLAPLALGTSCRRDADAPAGAAPRHAARKLPPHTEHADLVSALDALVTPQTRLIGLGELHSRVDRPAAPSTLSQFTSTILPALPERTSDLILETWTVDPRCGKVATKATASLQKATQRPETTRSELGILLNASNSRGLRAHAMNVRCEDYEAMSGSGDDAIIHMLDLTTSELARLANVALRRPPAIPRSPTPVPPSLVVIYGGAMHNDRFPAAGLEPWSYAPAVEGASDRTYLEIDLITPELAEGDAKLSAEPWAPLLGATSRVATFRRGERSYVIVLPRAADETAAPLR